MRSDRSINTCKVCNREVLSKVHDAVCGLLKLETNQTEKNRHILDK